MTTQVRTYKADRILGVTTENEIGDILKEYFQDQEIAKTANRYDTYDFIGGGAIPRMKYEIKSRRCSFVAYATTIIPKSKIAEGGPICFVFKFSDGLYYIYYDAELFDEFIVRDIKVFRDNRWGQPKPHLEIPTNLLIRIDV